MKRRIICMALLLATHLQLSAQQESHKTSANKTDIDPLALRVLKAATDPIQSAKSYSFRALVGREHPGTNGQVITLFHLSDVTVARPDKMHFDIRGKGKEVQLFYNAGQCTLYTPAEKLYSTMSCPKNIDAALDDLEKRDIFIPVRNFLASDPYESLAGGLTSGYVVGQAMLGDQPVTHLAFTEPEAEWQVWVVGGNNPQIKRLEVIDKSKPQHPRTTVDFVQWDLNANPPADLFTLNKPSDAKEIDLLKEAVRK